MSTSATRLKVMNDYSAQSFFQSFIRFSCDFGYSKFMLTDGSQLVKGCQTMQLCFKDIKEKVHKDMLVEFDICPVRGHNLNGKVDRKVYQIKKLLEESVSNQRLSVLQWEAVAAEVSNAISDLTFALGTLVSDFENMDLTTPNRRRNKI